MIVVGQSFDPDIPLVDGDSGRLKQVIANLLSNAVKFTPSGGEISIAVKGAESYVELSVSDTGTGIEADFLPHIFDRFRQADNSITRQHGGLGLGLSIAKHLVEMHGGTIRERAQARGMALLSSSTCRSSVATHSKSAKAI